MGSDLNTCLTEAVDDATVIVLGILSVGCLYELGYRRGQRAALRRMERQDTVSRVNQP